MSRSGMDSTRTPSGRHDKPSAAAVRSRCEALERRTLFAGTALYLTQAVTPAGLELAIDGSPGDDRISVVAHGDALVLANKGGWSVTLPDHFALLRINAARGNDVVIVDGTVETNAVIHGSNGDDTILGGAGDDRVYGGFGRDRVLGGGGDDLIVTVGDSVQDRVSGGDGFDQFWTDSARSETITDASADELSRGAANRVSGFFAPRVAIGPGNAAAEPSAAASRDLAGEDLPDPQPVVWPRMTYRDFSGRPLFAKSGPAPTDIKQGLIGDCYFLAAVASLVQADPSLVRHSVIEFGDGTYGVRFHEDGRPVYVRVDDDLPTWNSTTDPVYAALGPDDSMWVAVMEKAYAVFRRGEGTYASLQGGLPSEAYAAMGVASDVIRPDAANPADVLVRVMAPFHAGRPMSWTTYQVPAGVPLVESHAYAIVDVVAGANGQPAALRLLNPYGVDGAGDDGADDGYVTITADQARATFANVFYAQV